MSRAGVLAAFGAVLAFGACFVDWTDEPTTSAAPTANPPDGASLFRTKGCAGCHDGPDSEAMLGSSIPNLAHAPDWAASRKPGMTAEQYLEESILLPGAFTSPAFLGSVGPTDHMPDLEITGQEADALVAYLLHR